VAELVAGSVFFIFKNIPQAVGVQAFYEWGKR